MTLYLILTLLAWLCGVVCSLHALRLGNMAKKAARSTLRTSDLPPVSIVMTVHNQQQALQATLPAILSQDYPAPFEVIVVDMNSEDDTIEMLEEMEKTHVHLHHTFCPDSARDISLSRLALTLGFRSACYEWVLMLSPEAQTQSSQWLAGMAQSMQDNADAVQGFAFCAHPHGWTGIRSHFFQLWQQSLWMPWMANHRPYRADRSCLAYRKSLFMNHQGFASSFSLRFGATTLLVNHNLARGRMSLALHPDAFLAVGQPSTTAWCQQRVFYMETRRHMHHALPYRLWYATRLWVHYMWMPLAAFTLLHFHLPAFMAYACAALWFMALAIEGTAWHITAHRMHARSYVLLYPLLRALIPWWDAGAWLRWRFESRKTFRKKFV